HSPAGRAGAEGEGEIIEKLTVCSRQKSRSIHGGEREMVRPRSLIIASPDQRCRETAFGRSFVVYIALTQPPRESGMRNHFSGGWGCAESSLYLRRLFYLPKPKREQTYSLGFHRTVPCT